MTGITTHILDLTYGQPAAEVKVELFFFVQSSSTWQRLKTAETNKDGRVELPLLTGEETKIGSYELVFHIGEYFKGKDTLLANPPFLDQIPVRFGLADPTKHYHVPLLVSPWGYQVYRGS